MGGGAYGGKTYGSGFKKCYQYSDGQRIKQAPFSNTRDMESARIIIRIFSDTRSKESERPTGPHYTPVAAAIVPFLPVTNVSLSLVAKIFHG